MHSQNQGRGETENRIEEKTKKQNRKSFSASVGRRGVPSVLCHMAFQNTTCVCMRNTPSSSAKSTHSTEVAMPEPARPGKGQKSGATLFSEGLQV